VTEWLLLIHQLPLKPDYLRVKITRRLQRIGAIAVKHTVYVLPANDRRLGDLQQTAREIRDAGGEANLMRASFLEGLSDAEVIRRFHEARDAEYAPVIAEAKRLAKRVRRASAAKRREIAAAVAALRARLAAVQAIDDLGAPGGRTAAALLDSIDRALQSPAPAGGSLGNLRGRTWITRSGVRVDRMASAWLIRRFIDPRAVFRFVAGHAYQPAAGEIRFDMAGGEFTHDGDRCTFEALLDRSGIVDDALRAIAEIVHDIDLRDGKFARPEAAGVAALVDGIAHGTADDHERLRRAAGLFDDLYRSYSLALRGGERGSFRAANPRR